MIIAIEIVTLMKRPENVGILESRGCKMIENLEFNLSKFISKTLLYLKIIGLMDDLLQCGYSNCEPNKINPHA